MGRINIFNKLNKMHCIIFWGHLKNETSQNPHELPSLSGKLIFSYVQFNSRSKITRIKLELEQFAKRLSAA